MKELTDNELIAEFMGLTRKEANKSYNKAQYYQPSEDKRELGFFVGYFDSLKYSESWNWLMPVVEKICQHVYGEQMEEEPNGDRKVIQNTAYPRTFGMMTPDKKFMVRINRSQLFIADTLIQATYEAVIDFIKIK